MCNFLKNVQIVPYLELLPLGLDSVSQPFTDFQSCGGYDV